MNAERGIFEGGPVSFAEWERRVLGVHAALDADEFLDAVFKLLQATVVCDFALANLQNVNGVPLLARDSLGREFGPEYMERFFQLNPSVGYVMMRPGLRLLHTRDHLPPEKKLKAHPFYREFMKPEGWRHSVALLFWGFFPPVPQNAFCVFRSEAQPDFDKADLARLRVAHPHIGTALKRLKKQHGSRSRDDRISALLDALPGNATFVEWDLRITHQSAGARRLTARWTGQENELRPRSPVLPAEVLQACSEMRGDWMEALRINPQPRLLSKRMVRSPAVPGLSAEITLVLQQDSTLSHPAFLVRFVGDGSDAPGPEESSQDLTMLSPAEREAALLASDGLTNDEIAHRLGISVAAVKLRLHGAFKKLNVRNRTQLSNQARRR